MPYGHTLTDKTIFVVPGSVSYGPLIPMNSAISIVTNFHVIREGTVCVLKPNASLMLLPPCLEGTCCDTYVGLGAALALCLVYNMSHVAGYTTLANLTCARRFDRFVIASFKGRVPLLKLHEASLAIP